MTPYLPPYTVPHQILTGTQYTDLVPVKYCNDFTTMHCQTEETAILSYSLSGFEQMSITYNFSTAGSKLIYAKNYSDANNNEFNSRHFTGQG